MFLLIFFFRTNIFIFALCLIFYLNFSMLKKNVKTSFSLIIHLHKNENNLIIIYRIFITRTIQSQNSIFPFFHFFFSFGDLFMWIVYLESFAVFF